jgi:adenylate kinase family enzyme
MIWNSVSLKFETLTFNSVDDDIVCDIVQEQIEYNEKIKKSWVICGFPRTKV